MSNKLNLRFELPLYDEPKKPEPGAVRFRVEHVESTSNRYTHFPSDNEDRYQDDEDSPEFTGNLGYRNSMSLSDINKKVEELGLDPKAVHFTASFSDDYLILEVVHIRPRNEAEQLEDYEEALARWNNLKEDRKAAQLQNAKREMESLQRRIEELNKSK